MHTATAAGDIPVGETVAAAAAVAVAGGNKGDIAALQVKTVVESVDVAKNLVAEMLRCVVADDADGVDILAGCGERA